MSLQGWHFSIRHASLHYFFQENLESFHVLYDTLKFFLITLSCKPSRRVCLEVTAGSRARSLSSSTYIYRLSGLHNRSVWSQTSQHDHSFMLTLFSLLNVLIHCLHYFSCKDSSDGGYLSSLTVSIQFRIITQRPGVRSGCLISRSPATFKTDYTEHQLSVSPYWSGHCYHSLQICTCVHSLSSRRSQTWMEVCPLSCEKPPFKKKKKYK